VLDDAAVDDAGDVDHGDVDRPSARRPEERAGGGPSGPHPHPDGVAALDRVIDGERQPRSTYRQAQAAATRERIAEAARRLFGVAGYGSTSIEAIAAEAVRTVYSAFGTKREILWLICERWLERARARELAGRNQAMDAMIASLDGHLRAPVRQVQAVYRALAAPGVYRELVEESGWTPEEFERWVGDTLERYAAGGR